MPKASKARTPAKARKTAPKATKAPEPPAQRPPVVPKTPAKARLGDDLPALASGAAPRLSREPVTIIVARTDVVAGGVRIKSTGPSALRLAKGQVVHVKHAYRLQEHPRWIRPGLNYLPRQQLWFQEELHWMRQRPYRLWGRQCRRGSGLLRER